MKYLQYLLFCIIFKVIFPNFRELTQFVFFDYPGAAQDIALGLDLLGDLFNPNGNAMMSMIVRKQFLTIQLLKPLLRHLCIGNQHMSAKIIHRIINTILTPVVISEFYSDSDLKMGISNIYHRSLMRFRCLVYRTRPSILWYYGDFTLFFYLPTVNNDIYLRILSLNHPFWSRIDPKNEIFNKYLFISWAVIAKLTIDIDDCRMFGQPVNPNKTVRDIICSLTDDEILCLLASHEVSVIVRRYIQIHIQQCAIRDVIVCEKISRDLVWETVESAMRNYHQRIRSENCKVRTNRFNGHVVLTFIRLLESSSLILSRAGFKHQIHNLMDVMDDSIPLIETQPFNLLISFPFIAPDVIMKLQNLVNVSHQFEIDLNELTFLVIWTAIYNLRFKRLQLITRSKFWLQQLDWSERQRLKTASPELILFLATIHEGIPLIRMLEWLSNEKRQERP